MVASLVAAGAKLDMPDPDAARAELDNYLNGVPNERDDRQETILKSLGVL